MDLDTIGLSINFFGALLLAIGASIQSEISMSHLKQSLNYPGSPNGIVPNAVQKNIARIKRMKISNIINIIGYACFIAGFALQLFFRFCY